MGAVSRRFALAGAAIAACAVAAPSAAPAVEQQGRGVDVSHVRNLPFPNLRQPDTQNAGTDLEITVIALPEPPAPPAVKPKKPASKKKAKKKKPARSCRTVKTKSGKKKKVCKKKKARKRKASSRRAGLRDLDPGTPGIQRRYAIAGSYGDGLHVVDVSEPENATIISSWDCGISQGDVQVFRRADLGGRVFATFTQDDGYDFSEDARCAKELAAMGFKLGDGSGTYIVELTDPYAPKTTSFVPFPQGSHNQTVHPSGRYLYNSNSDLITSFLPAIEIADITDLAAPKTVGEIALKTLPGLGTESHDVTFNDTGTRAYVAALSHGEILDTTDPANPTSIGTVVDPTLTVWHQMDQITLTDPVLGERDFLIAEDEVAGASPTGQCPNGGVHVYDATGELETAPLKVGYWNIADAGPTEDGLGTCTAHVFQLHREAKLMTIAYYNGGVRVVDLTHLVGVALGGDGMGMSELGSFRFPDSDTWAAKAGPVSREGFYFYGNDHRRGFDVYKYAPTTAGRRATGTWMTPEQLVQAQAEVGGAVKLAALCLLGRKDTAEAARRAGLGV